MRGEGGDGVCRGANRCVSSALLLTDCGEAAGDDDCSCSLGPPEPEIELLLEDSIVGEYPQISCSDSCDGSFFSSSRKFSCISGFSRNFFQQSLQNCQPVSLNSAFRQHVVGGSGGRLSMITRMCLLVDFRAVFWGVRGWLDPHHFGIIHVCS